MNRPAGADVALAQMAVERAIAAQQARIAAWDTRMAASLAATGRRLTGIRPVPPDQYVRVRQSQLKLERARQRQAAAASGGRAGLPAARRHRGAAGPLDRPGTGR